VNIEVKSAGRILDLLEFLAGCTGPVKLKAIAVELGFPMSSAHALAQTLVSRGYVVQDATDRYALVPDIRHGSAFWPREARLVSTARPVMEALLADTDETVVISIRTNGGDVRRVAKSVSRQLIHFDVELDSPTETYCTASGRVLLAHWIPAAREAHLAHRRIIAYTPQTVTDVVAIRRILADVVTQGFAICDEEFVLGYAAVAAPIRGRQGDVIAAINLGATSARFRLNRDRYIASVMNSAKEISRRACWRELL
jgi:DNA-binding IclR family transcriptional regulator